MPKEKRDQDAKKGTEPKRLGQDRDPTNEKPISLQPLTLEETLRKAMGTPPPADEPKPAKTKERKKAKRK